MENNELMLGVLTKYFNKTEDEIKALVYEDDGEGNFTEKEGAMDALIELHSVQIERIKKEVGDNASKKFDDFAKKTKKEVLTKLEGELKGQYGIESENTGVDLIAEIVEKSKGSTDITEESLKTNPIFLKLEKETKEKYEGEIGEVKNEYEDFKTQVERGKKMSAVRTRAKTVFLGLNPALSDDQAKADIQVNDFLERLNGYDYNVSDNDIIILKNGERVEDGHSNPIAFDTFIKGEAEKRFDFLEQTPRDTPGNRNKPGSGSGKKKITTDEYNDMMATAHTPEAIKNIIENYEW